MIDENLPTFLLKPTQQKHLWTLYLAQHGDEPIPVYTLRRPDPAGPNSTNRYALALTDPFVPDIIYGEVLIIPEWTQPSLSADTIRQNGGVTPSPEPILPTRFTIHLYNPDQEITVQFKPKTWNNPATWTFEMPQHTFRQPSSSTLDRTQTDPAIADTTPKLRFSWRRDSKLSKDLTCLLSGKTTTLSDKAKTKSKEPDITLSIFQSLRELTLYEPNLYRVEMEDFKGLEVVLLLSAVTIRDVYFNPMKDSFRLSRSASGSPTSTVPPATVGAASTAATAPRPRNDPPVATGALTTQIPQKQPDKQSSPTDRRTQEMRKEEERRTKKMLEEEEKARKKRQAEVDKETRRLQKLYGQEEQRVRIQTPSLPPRPSQPPRPQSNLPLRPGPQNPQYYHHHSTPSVPSAQPRPGPYLGVPGGDGRRQSSLGLVPVRPHSTGMRPTGAQQAPVLQPKKSSFFGFRKNSDETKLSKKRSSMF